MNVSRVYRLLQLITILRSGRSLDADGLAGELDVSRRTLFRDLKLLERACVPYHYDHEKNRYTIAESFFLPPVQLDVEEALALLLVTRKFLSNQVHPHYQKAVHAALKIESALPPMVLEHCGHWLSGISMHWPPTSTANVVSRVFEVVQRALAEKIRLRVTYDSVHDGGEIETLLDPLRIVFFSRGWYLLAKSHLHQEVRTFKIDRIVEVSPTEDHFTPDADFSERKYFGKAWRMIPEGTIYKVKLRFSAAVAASVEEVYWHETQTTLRLEDGRLIFEASVDGLREISAWVLSYGHEVEVLSPPELRDSVRQRAEKVVLQAQALDAGEAG